MTNAPNFLANSNRLPPQNIEAEEAILGGILLDPEAISRVAELLKSENFAVQAHQIIYHAALTLHLQGKPTDLMTVTSWLADQNQLEKVGGQGKLAQLVEQTISAINIDQYSHLVVDKSIRRQLIKTGAGIVDLAYQTELELEQVLDQSEQLLLNVTQVRPQQTLVPIGETLINTFQDIEDRNEGVTLPGIPCGFYDLDAMTGGFQRSDLIIVAGRPSMGKCLSQDAEIVLADGSIATIKEIYSIKKAQLLTLKQNFKFEITQPSAFVDDGIKPVFRVVTKLGRTIESTLTHPYLTQQGWLPLSQLKVGNKIAVPRIINIFGNQKLPRDQIKQLAQNLENNFIPKIVFELERSLIAFFLHEFFAVPIHSSHQPINIYNSNHHKLLLQIQHLLLRFGIITTLKYNQKTWKLEITEADSIQILISEIVNLNDQYWSESQFQQKSATASIQVNSISILEQDRLASTTTVLNPEVYWDEIDAIQFTGFKPVYDLTIPETHNFVANDICVHNTSFAVGIAHNIAKNQKLSTAIYSLEMSKEQLVQRLLSSESRIESNRLRSGRISQAEWEPLTQAIGTLSELSIFIDDTPNITVTEMRSKARRLQAEQGEELGLVLIDYLQLMEGSSDNRVQELSRITRALKGMARELNVPVIALSQLSRGVEARTNKRPMMSDLRESGCITGDSLISLANQGIEVPIQELIGKSGFAVWAINPATMKLEKATVSHVFSTGVKPIFKLKTALGRTIRATANHKFLTIQGWQRLDQLTIGSQIALPRHIPSFFSNSMNDAELGLLGHLIGDGCTLPRHAIQYTTKEKDLANIVVSLAAQVFSHDIKPRIVQERNWYQVYLPANYHLTHNQRNPIAKWLDSLGIFGLRSHEKFVPNLIFQQSQAAIATFLRHLWSTDGSIKLVKGKSIRPIAYYASSSEKLAYHVQSLLLRLDINAKIYVISQKNKGQDNFHVIITGKPDLEKFVQNIGTVGNYKIRSLLEIAEYLAVHSANTNRDIIPRDVWKMLAIPAMHNCGLTTRQMQSQLGTQYCGTTLYKHNLSRERAVKLAQVVQSEKLALLAESDIYWDKVISIEPDGYEEVYDLTVPGLHNFIANNIVVHNSIEQDADLVIMLYRDDYYNPDTPDRGISEIIITKHRNGPTGTVKLLFDPQFTRFRNLAASERYSFPKNPPNQLPPG